MMEIEGFNELANLAIGYALNEDERVLARMEKILSGGDDDTAGEAIDEICDLVKVCVYAAANIAVVRLGTSLQARKGSKSTPTESLPSDPLKGVEHPQLGS